MGISLKTYLFIVTLFLTGLCAIKFRINVTRSQRYWLFALFFIPAFWSPVKNVIKSGWSSESNILDSGLPELRFFNDIVKSYNEVISSNSYFAKIIQTSDNWNPITDEQEYDTYILVIGESVRKDFMQAYGFEGAENTPWMNSINGSLFNDYISSAGATQPSLINSLTLRNNKQQDLNNSLLTLAKRAGFETYWLSNQGAKGKYDSPVAMIGKQANHSVFLKSGSSDDRSYKPDEELLPTFKNILDTPIQSSQKTHNKLIILHLMGSHPQPCVRTNNKFDKFIQSNNISCYIQSITQTDKLLSIIAQEANNHHLKWTMIYFSDHGLRITDKGTDAANLIHGDEFKQNYQVPFFMTSYNATSRNTIQSRRSGLSMLPLLAYWLGIHESRISVNCNWLNDEPCENQSNVISFKNEIKYYDDLLEDPHNIVETKR